MDQLVLVGRAAWVTARSWRIASDKKAYALARLQKRQAIDPAVRQFEEAAAPHTEGSASPQHDLTSEEPHRRRRLADKEDAPHSCGERCLLLVVTFSTVALILCTEETTQTTAGTAPHGTAGRRFEAPYSTAWASNLDLAAVLPLALLYRSGRCSSAIVQGGHTWGSFLRACTVPCCLGHAGWGHVPDPLSRKEKILPAAACRYPG
jgi:hypothetical protein